MHSLRIKFSLALIITSMSAVIVVGIIAQWRISTRFDQMAMERAFEIFKRMLRAILPLTGLGTRHDRSNGLASLSDVGTC